MAIQSAPLLLCLRFAQVHNIPPKIQSSLPNVSLDETHLWYVAQPRITGFNFRMSSSWDHALADLIISLSFSVIAAIAFLEGLMRSLPLNLRKFQPRKSKPLSIWTIRVFSSESSSPRSFRKSTITSLHCSAIFCDSAVTRKSSANLMRFTSSP